jgi:hypothetical protein
MRIPRVVSWVVVPALLGGVLAALVDVTSLPFVGTEKIQAVFFTDGQAYFGHLDDNALSGTLTLRDVYYLGDAKGRGTDFDASVVRRGSEVHQPADGMRVRRNSVLVIERVGLNSPVARAIAVQRALERAAAK